LHSTKNFLPLFGNKGFEHLFSENAKHMNIENTQSQMRKGILEFCILSIIRRGEAYPSDIVEEMKAANLHILEGTLYPLLTRLKNAEMLTYRWVESNSGPPRKYFSLTDKGLQFYKELEATWNELASAVNTLANKKESMPDSTNQNPSF
jgi:PadR family transcriptional regulator, regulatory protein PadR